MRFQYCFYYLIFLVLFTACEPKLDTLKEPEIKWIEDSFSVKGNYLMGGFAGYSFKGRFKVIGESGDVEVAIKVGNQDSTKVTVIHSVVSGETYELSVLGRVSGSNRDTKPQDCDFRVVFSSQNALDDLVMDIFGYNVSDEYITYYFCPTSLTFGDIYIK